MTFALCILTVLLTLAIVSIGAWLALVVRDTFARPCACCVCLRHAHWAVIKGSVPVPDDGFSHTLLARSRPLPPCTKEKHRGRSR